MSGERKRGSIGELSGISRLAPIRAFAMERKRIPGTSNGAGPALSEEVRKWRNTR